MRSEPGPRPFDDARSRGERAVTGIHVVAWANGGRTVYECTLRHGHAHLAARCAPQNRRRDEWGCDLRDGMPDAVTTMSAQVWPSLRVEDWVETRDTLHMWMQIVGKVRLSLAPLINHWWQVTFYVSPRGLTTSAVPYGGEVVDAEFDFVEHRLVVRSSSGGVCSVSLAAMSVAEFYVRAVAAFESLGVPVDISPRPNEVEPAIPFAEDDRHASYDPRSAQLFWRQVLAASSVIGRFRSRFVGKVSPVHFFWGSMDLACTRFSGRLAPPHPGGAPNCGDWVMVEGYSRELSSCGFWPGGGIEGAFYSYAYPEPDGFRDHPVEPTAAFYSDELRQFLLPYEAVRTAAEPERTLTDFLSTTYDAAADCGGWDRALLEDDPGRWGNRHVPW